MYIQTVPQSKTSFIHKEAIKIRYILGPRSRFYNRYIDFNYTMTLHIVLKPFTFIPKITHYRISVTKKSCMKTGIHLRGEER